MLSESKRRSIAIWFNKNRKHVNGWTFEYEEFLGVFAYYKGNIAIYFTPDFNQEGVLDISRSNISTGEDRGLASLAYPKPLGTAWLYNAVSLFLV